MEKYQRSVGRDSYRAFSEERGRPSQGTQKREITSPAVKPGSLLGVGAKTIAGIGIGLLTVIGGAALLGVAAEIVLVPSLLVKLAGGIAGGGVGMAKGLKDTRTPE